MYDRTEYLEISLNSKLCENGKGILYHHMIIRHMISIYLFVIHVVVRQPGPHAVSTIGKSPESRLLLNTDILGQLLYNLMYNYTYFGLLWVVWLHLVPSQAITGCPSSQTISMIQAVIESWQTRRIRHCR